MVLNKDRLRLDCQRSQAAQYFARNYSRDKRYLVILSRDLAKEFRAINSMGIMKAEKVCETDLKDSAKQIYFDFICDFEKLKELMKEFRWSKDLLKENGIDFNSLRQLYFAVC